MNAERSRLEEARTKKAPWKKWGPYLSERQWEPCARTTAKARRLELLPARPRPLASVPMGEDGLAGISDEQQHLCFALALWNGKDPIIKERLFGLTGAEGNHAEDVKEYYFYLDSTPTHSYMKYLYKYPQAAFPMTIWSRRTVSAAAVNRNMNCSTPVCLTRTAILMSSWSTPKPPPKTCSYRSPSITAGRNRRRSSFCPPSGFAMIGHGR